MYRPQLSPAIDQALRGLPAGRIAVLGHVRPDGDCIGSQVALTRILRALGREAVAVNWHPVPTPCRPFVGDTPFVLGEGFDFAGHTVVSVDCADRKRFGKEFEPQVPAVELNLDHHVSNTRYARVNFVDDKAAATGELLAMAAFDNAWPLDAVTAQALYVGIATDTGQFRYNSTSLTTFELCRRLVELGADPAGAAASLYENERPAKIALLQRYLASFEHLCGGRACVGTLLRRDFVETGAEREDTEGLVEYARAIAGVEIGVLLEEMGPASMKGSFRAKDPAHRVDQLAARFNGGGHACAAGFNPETDLASFRPLLRAALEEHFQQFDAPRAHVHRS